MGSADREKVQVAESGGAGRGGGAVAAAPEMWFITRSVMLDWVLLRARTCVLADVLSCFVFLVHPGVVPATLA